MDYRIRRVENGWVLMEDNGDHGFCSKAWICETPGEIADVVKRQFVDADKQEKARA